MNAFNLNIRDYKRNLDGSIDSITLENGQKFESDVGEIEKNKTVTITENGTVTIKPSAGKDAMKKVTATINVSGGGGGSLMNIPAFKSTDENYYQGVKADGSLCANISDLANAVWIIIMNSGSGAAMAGFTTLDSSEFSDFANSVYGSDYPFSPSANTDNTHCIFSVQEDTLTITNGGETVLDEVLEKVDLPLGIALFSNHSS
jgi:hypothetical protein